MLNRTALWIAISATTIVTVCGEGQAAQGSNPTASTTSTAVTSKAASTTASSAPAPTAAKDAAALKQLARDAYDHAGSGGEPPAALYPYLSAALRTDAQACLNLQDKKNIGKAANQKTEGNCLDGAGSIVFEGAADWDKMYASRKFEVGAIQGDRARIKVMMRDAGETRPEVAFVLLAVRENGAWKIDDILTAGRSDLSARAMLKESMARLSTP